MDGLGVLKSRLWRHGEKENGMQRWTPIAGCVGQAEGTHVTWADHCAEIERLKQVRCEGCGYLVSEREHLGCKSEKTLKDLERLTTERDNAEKREYEVLGRANALEAELKATQARLVASDELLREEFAQRQDALATLRDIGDFAHDRSTGPAVEDALWEVRRMAYELLTPNAALRGSQKRRVKCEACAVEGCPAKRP